MPGNCRIEALGRPLVPGRARGEAVVVRGAISFYGDVDPARGLLRDGRSLAGKVLVAERSRGSTVGSYVIMGLRYSGRAPAAILMVEAEPIVVAGAVLAGVPLVDRLPAEILDRVRDGWIIEVDEQGKVVAEGEC